MDKLYKIKDNYAEILLNSKLYPVIAIKKALSNYLENTYVKMDYKDEQTIKIEMVLKEESKEDLEKIIGELYNELFNETLRYEISVETKNLRELIVGRALYTTCIDTETEQEKNEENEKIEETLEDYNVDDIATNWFDKSENK